MDSSALYSFRSDGSRGMFDIGGLFHDKLRLVQCKINGYIKPQERKELKNFLLTKPPWVQVEIHIMISPKKTKKFIINAEKDIDRFQYRLSKLDKTLEDEIIEEDEYGEENGEVKGLSEGTN
jgi:hypothetical protein